MGNSFQQRTGMSLRGVALVDIKLCLLSQINLEVCL